MFVLLTEKMHPLVCELLAHENYDESKILMSINREIRGDLEAWKASSKFTTQKQRNALMFSAMVGDTQRTKFLMNV